MSQVLRTYEGRRLHEKLQHVAKLNMELAAAPQMDAEEGRSADDNSNVITIIHRH